MNTDCKLIWESYELLTELAVSKANVQRLITKYGVDEAAARSLINRFNEVEGTLAKRDIFTYNNIDELETAIGAVTTEREQVLEQSEGSSANQGIIFRQNSAKEDTGCCIGVKHGGSIKVSIDLIKRINEIPNLKFYAEGSAGKNPQDEPGMLPFLQTNFPEASIEKQSWDDITEKKGEGSANTKYNVIFVFMQHRFNKIIDWYPARGTMLDAMARPIASKNKNWPTSSPSSYEERLQWLTMHMKKAGVYDALNKPYSRRKLLKIMDQMEASCYPKGQQFPDTSTYFGKMAKIIEDQRNQTIYDLMGKGGCCFAGAGHLIELKQQFPKLNTIDLDKISG